MSRREPTLVVGFGTSRNIVGFAATRCLATYEIKRRLGEWESTFVGPHGAVQYIIPEQEYGDATALRDLLNDQPHAATRAIADARSLDRERVELIRRLLEIAVALHSATGEQKPALRALLSEVVGGERSRAARFVAAHEHLTAVAIAAVENPPPSYEIGDFSAFPFDAVVFDLDQTLIDSSSLDSPSRRRAWAFAARRPEDALRPIDVDGPVAPHKLPSLLRAQGVPVGIATCAPQLYGQAACVDQEIEFDALIAGNGDTTRTVMECARALGVAAARVVVVGDQRADFQAAAAVGAWSVGALWAEPWDQRYEPDVAVSDPALLLATPDWRLLRYVGEAANRAVVHVGSRIARGDVDALGRYFVANEPRHNDPLSRAIIAGKGRQASEAPIVRALQALAETGWADDVDAVASVPPAHGKIDRFADYRVITAEAIGVQPIVALRTARDVGGYKHMGPLERQHANEGRFDCTADVEGARIVLLDDVVTTGSTFLACRQVLETAGASGVYCVAFGATQARVESPNATTGFDRGRMEQSAGGGRRIRSAT